MLKCPESNGKWYGSPKINLKGGQVMNISRKVFLKRSVVGLAVLLVLASTTSWAAPMGNTRFVDVDGIRTGYVEGGSGEALVLIHGGGFGSSSHFSNNWRPIFDHLTSHFHV